MKKGKRNKEGKEKNGKQKEGNGKGEGKRK